MFSVDELKPTQYDTQFVKLQGCSASFGAFHQAPHGASDCPFHEHPELQSVAAGKCLGPTAPLTAMTVPMCISEHFE